MLFRSSGRWWGASLPYLRYAFIIGLITTFSYLIRRGKYAVNKIFDLPQTKWFIMVVLVMLLTWPIAIDQYHHRFFLTIVLKYFLLYYLIVKTIDSPIKFERMIEVFLVGQFYVGWFAYQMGRTGEGRLERIGGADGRDANAAAAVMVVAVPIVINYLITGKKWQKICALPMLVFILNALILINSRGAFIAMIISILYYLFLSLKSPSFPKFSKAKVLSVMALGIIIFVYLTDPIYLNRMASITASEEETTSYTGRERVDFWLVAFDMVRDHPWGLGAWGYQAMSPQYLPVEDLSPVTGTRAVHSMYFEALAEFGYHGLAIFILFLYSNFKFSRKLRNSLKKVKYYQPYSMAVALESGYLAILIAGIFISTLYMEVIYWMAAFSAAYGNIYFKKIKEIESGERKIKVVT